MLDSLKIVCYIDSNTGDVHPFIQEGSSVGTERIVFNFFQTMIDQVKGYSSFEKEQLKKSLSKKYYIDLLKKGYSFEEMYSLLSDVFSKQYDSLGHDGTLNYIISEKEALCNAYQEFLNYDESIGLKQMIDRFTKKLKR